MAFHVETELMEKSFKGEDLLLYSNCVHRKLFQFKKKKSRVSHGTTVLMLRSLRDGLDKRLTLVSDFVSEDFRNASR